MFTPDVIISVFCIMALAQTEGDSTFFGEGKGSARLPSQTLEPDIHIQVNMDRKAESWE